MGESDPMEQAVMADATDKAFQRAQSLAPKVAGLAAAAGVLFAVAGGVLQTGAPVPVIVFLTVVVLVLGVVATLVAKVASRNMGIAGEALAWGLVLIFVATIGLVLSSAFLGRPEPGAHLVALWLNAPELICPGHEAPVTVTSSVPLSRLGSGLLGEVPGEGPVAKAAALAKLPALEVRNATLTLSGPAERRVVSTSRLVLADGGIVTNGGTLVIETLEVEIRQRVDRRLRPSRAVWGGARWCCGRAGDADRASATVRAPECRFERAGGTVRAPGSRGARRRSRGTGRTGLV